MGECIVYTEIRLLLLHPFISFFFLSNRNCEAYKLENRYTYGQWVNVAYILESDCCCLFIPLFLHFSFSPIFIHLHFRRTFLRNCWAYKVNTWYTRGQWLDVLCVPKSDCCCLFIPLCNFSFQFSNIKIFVTLFSGTMRPTKLRLGTRVDNGLMYCVYQNQAAAAYLSLYFFIFLSNFQTLKVFRRTFIRNCEPSKLKLGTHVENG